MGIYYGSGTPQWALQEMEMVANTEAEADPQAARYPTALEQVLITLYAEPLNELAAASQALSDFVRKVVDAPMDPNDPHDLPF